MIICIWHNLELALKLFSKWLGDTNPGTNEHNYCHNTVHLALLVSVLFAFYICAEEKVLVLPFLFLLSVCQCCIVVKALEIQLWTKQVQNLPSLSSRSSGKVIQVNQVRSSFYARLNVMSYHILYESHRKRRHFEIVPSLQSPTLVLFLFWYGLDWMTLKLWINQ